MKNIQKIKTKIRNILLAKNKRAKIDFEILEKFEAGIELSGQEVKSAKLGNISLKGSYVMISHTGPSGQPEAWLLNAYISPYRYASKLEDYKPDRSRKLLLHKREIRYLMSKQKEKGLTLVPLCVYTRGGRIKIEFAVARGKKKFDRREEIRKQEAEKKIRRALRSKIMMSN